MISIFEFGGREIAEHKPSFIEFPGGEVSPRIPADFPRTSLTAVMVECLLKNPSDYMKLFMVLGALKAHPDVIERQLPISLELKYVPYGRQDRVTGVGDSLDVKTFAGLINSFKLAEVFIYAPHSDVTPAVFNNVLVEPTSNCIKDLIRTQVLNKDVVLIAPDVGASKWVYKVADELGIKEVWTGLKTRDPETGRLKYTGMVGGQIVGSKTQYLVVDDICDGGATFLALAEVLALNGIHPEQLHLAVVHGIFSKGKEELLKHYATIESTFDWADYN